MASCNASRVVVSGSAPSQGSSAPRSWSSRTHRHGPRADCKAAPTPGAANTGIRLTSGSPGPSKISLALRMAVIASGWGSWVWAGISPLAGEEAEGESDTESAKP